MIMILEKKRAPSRNMFHKGLGCEMLNSSRLLLGKTKLGGFVNELGDTLELGFRAEHVRLEGLAELGCRDSHETVDFRAELLQKSNSINLPGLATYDLGFDAVNLVHVAGRLNEREGLLLQRFVTPAEFFHSALELGHLLQDRIQADTWGLLCQLRQLCHRYSSFSFLKGTICHDALVAGTTGTSDNGLLYSDYMEKAMTNKKSAFLLFRSLNTMDFMIKNFFFLLSPKTWFEPIVFSGSLAVLKSRGEAAPNSRGVPRPSTSSGRNAFGLIQEYCTIEEIASFEGSPRFARRLICIGFSGQKRIGDFERIKENFLVINPTKL